MMLPNRTSEAHDFSLFEEREDKKIKMNPKPLNKPAAARSGSVIKTLLLAICAITLPVYLLVSKVELSELSVKISEESMALEKAESENSRLQAELDNLVTVAKVEEYAKELGMQKVATNQGKYVSLDTGGTTDIAEINDSPVVFVSKWFANTLEFLGFR
ncbi:MAG: hypothetical protein FWG44_01220 [Oscillospiraceae bacterium]|nr:hypothetical protein [Oscillospiraceae bacterium]